jgi:hypothetical protein
MATPYSGVSNNPDKVAEDYYNFYHSQLCIRVECAFGMLVQRWGIIWTAMPRNLSIAKIIAIVNALARLHNFCIDETNTSQTVPRSMDRYSHHIMSNQHGYVELSTERDAPVPTDLINGGEHFSNIECSYLCNHQFSNPERDLPCKQLNNIIINGHWEQPTGNIRRDD